MVQVVALISSFLFPANITLFNSVSSQDEGSTRLVHDVSSALLC
jgi:hypothetical protein